MLQEHTIGLMTISGVRGTAQGLCVREPCIRVFVVERSDELLSQIPPEIQEYPLEVQGADEFRELEHG